MNITIEDKLENWVENDDPIVIEEIIRHNQINQTFLDEMLIRSIACNGCIETIQILLEGRADPTALKYEAMIYAAQLNRKNVVEKILSYEFQFPLEIMLIVYSGIGEIEKVKNLLENNVNLHAYNGKALLFAIEHSYTDIAQLIIEKGFNIHLGEESALEAAISANDLEIVKILLNKGADPTINNCSPLMNALATGHLEIVNLILNNNYRFSDEVFLLVYSHMGSYELVHDLLQKGVNIHHNNEEALKEAMSKNHLNIVNLLLLYGANIHISDNWPMCHAILSENKALYQLLRTHGAIIPSHLLNQARILENSNNA